VLDGEQAAMVGGAEGVTGKRKRDETTQEAAGIGAEPPEESAVNEFSMFEQGGPGLTDPMPTLTSLRVPHCLLTGLSCILEFGGGFHNHWGS